jgi:hypothetical protein
MAIWNDVAGDLIWAYGYAPPLYAAENDSLADSEGTTRIVVTFNILFVASASSYSNRFMDSKWYAQYSVSIHVSNLEGGYYGGNLVCVFL